MKKNTVIVINILLIGLLPINAAFALNSFNENHLHNTYTNGNFKEVLRSYLEDVEHSNGENNTVKIATRLNQFLNQYIKDYNDKLILAYQAPQSTEYNELVSRIFPIIYSSEKGNKSLENLQDGEFIKSF